MSKPAPRRMPWHTLLTANEERELGRRVRRADGYPLCLADAGDVYADALAARDGLIGHNLGLVSMIAKELAGRGLDLDDLEGEGYLGLIRAAEKYRPDLDYRFSTYAASWIRSFAHRATRGCRSPVGVPSEALDYQPRWRRLRAELGRDPSPAEMGLDPGAARRVADAARVLEAGRSPLPDEVAAAAAGAESPDRLAEAAAEALAVLPAREREVLALRYGLGGGPPRTCDQVGKIVGVHGETAARIARRALAAAAGRLGGGAAGTPRGAGR